MTGHSCECVRSRYRLVSDPLSVDEELCCAGSVGLGPAELVYGDAAESARAQRKPAAAGVITSHDHRSHTRKTLTAAHKTAPQDQSSYMFINICDPGAQNQS